MAVQGGFFDLDQRYQRLSEAGDPLERLNERVDFEIFRADLEAALKATIPTAVRQKMPGYDPSKEISVKSSFDKAITQELSQIPGQIVQNTFVPEL